MSLSVLLSFWGVSLLFSITPGMDWAYAISAGIRGRAVVPGVTGLLLGHGAATLLVAAGVGSILANTPLALTSLTVLGACYLLWLGIGALRHPKAPQSQVSVLPDKSWQWLVKGMGVSGLNPKVVLMFLALLPQFTDPNSHWPLPLQLLTLGGLHLLTCSVIYFSVGFGANFVLTSRPSAAKLVSRLSGAAMTIIAIVLLTGPLLEHTYY